MAFRQSVAINPWFEIPRDTICMAAHYISTEASFEADAPWIRKLWTASLGSRDEAVAAGKLTRGYIENPAGRGACLLLKATGDDAPVGVLGLHPRRFHLGERVLHGAGLADYAVDSAHRSLGPALMLMKRSVEYGRAHFDLVYGLPNPASAAVCGRAGLKKLGLRVRYAKVLGSLPYMRRRMPGVAAAVLSVPANVGLRMASLMRQRMLTARLVCKPATFDAPELDKIWAQRPRDLMLSERSAAMLRWRFTSVPADAWRLALACDRSGAPIGYVVWRLLNGVADVGDFLCTDPAGLTTALLLAFKRMARHAGAHSVSLEFFGNESVVEALHQIGFTARAERLPVFCAPSPHEAVNLASTWYVTPFDNDAD